MEVKDLVELNAQELEQVNGGISWIGGLGFVGAMFSNSYLRELEITGRDKLTHL